MQGIELIGKLKLNIVLFYTHCKIFNRMQMCVLLSVTNYEHLQNNEMAILYLKLMVKDHQSVLLAYIQTLI